MMNISPIGRNCNKDERNAYEEYDLVSSRQLLLTGWCDAIQQNRMQPNDFEANHRNHSN